MARTKQTKRKGHCEAPCLSEVELTAVIVWLDHEIACTEKQLITWRVAAQRSQDATTLGSLKYHETARTAFASARSRVRQTLELRLAAGTLPRVSLTPGTVLARQETTE